MWRVIPGLRRLVEGGGPEQDRTAGPAGTAPGSSPEAPPEVSPGTAQGPRAVPRFSGPRPPRSGPAGPSAAPAAVPSAVPSAGSSAGPSSVPGPRPPAPSPASSPAQPPAAAPAAAPLALGAPVPARPGPDERADRPAGAGAASRPDRGAAPVAGPARATRTPRGAEPPGSSQTSLEIYNAHFGLVTRPFSLVPDPDFLFWSPAHKRAYTMLEYGILTHAPITMITGEVGAGKTTLVHHLLRTLGKDVTVGLISNPHGSRGELLRWVLMALNQPAEAAASYVDLFARFQSCLIEEYAAGRRVVLIFDEAQNLGREALEELRMFTNINSGKDELLQLVLVGQPELRDIVLRRDMRQFAQRVAANFHLPAMDLRTVRAYIDHRLRVAGLERRIFSDSAVELIFRMTGGVPRLVNRLCDLAMVYTFTKGNKLVSQSAVQQVLDDGAFLAVETGPDEGGA
jgi:general secretion pathway protein A